MCSLHVEEEAHLAAMAGTRTPSPRPRPHDTNIELFEICWEDVLIPHMSIYLSLKDLFNLRSCSQTLIIVECKDLRILKLSKCQWLTTGAVDALTLHQSKLVEFDISHCGAIGERCLIIFFRKLNKLTVLSLAHTPSVTDQVLIQIGNYCRELEHINLNSL